MVRVLYLAPTLPTRITTAAEVRVSQLIPRLAKAVDLKVVAFGDEHPPADAVHFAGCSLLPLAKGKVAELRATVGRLPRSVAKHGAGNATGRFAAEVSQFRPDVVHFDSFGSLAQFDRTASYKSVFHVHDAISAKFPSWIKASSNIMRRLDLSIQMRKTRAFERRVLPMADVCVVDSEEDACYLREKTGANVRVVPVGYDEELYGTAGPQMQLPAPSLMFSGGMGTVQSTEAAVWFVQEVFPRILKSHPTAKLYLVGSNPTQAVQQLADSHPQVELTGFVQDLAAYLRSCTVYVCPLRVGGGMRTRLVEAMACGCAIVATSNSTTGLSAPQSLPAAWLQEDEAAPFAEAVSELLSNAGKRKGLKVAAADAALRYSWKASAEAVEALYRECISGGRK